MCLIFLLVYVFIIFFIACLTLEGSSEICGQHVLLEVKYKFPSSKDEEELILLVKNLPIPKIPEQIVKKLLEKYFLKHTSKQPSSCSITNKTAHLTFENSAGMLIVVVVFFLLAYLCIYSSSYK